MTTESFITNLLKFKHQKMILCKDNCICSLCRQLRGISNKKCSNTSDGDENFSFGNQLFSENATNFIFGDINSENRSNKKDIFVKCSNQERSHKIENVLSGRVERSFKKNGGKKFTFFGMEVDLEQQAFEKFSTIGKTNRRKAKNSNMKKFEDKIDKNNNDQPTTKHKSVIYINDSEKSNANALETAEETAGIKITEKIDKDFILEYLEHCKVINVIYKNTFGYACQLIDEITICAYEFYEDDGDDFPLGMEADMIYQYLSRKRYSGMLLNFN